MPAHDLTLRLQGTSSGRTYRVTTSPFVIGSSTGCALVLEHSEVLASHVVISFNNDWSVTRQTMEGEVSLDGVSVEAGQVTSITPGSLLQIGPYIFECQTSSQSSEAVVNPSSPQPGHQSAPSADRSREWLIAAIMVLVCAIGLILWPHSPREDPRPSPEVRRSQDIRLMDSALEQMAQFQWDAAVEILSQIPSDSTQAVAIAERIALCKREASLAPVLAEIERLQHSQKWLEAWSEYVSKVPINSYSLRKARQSFVPYRDLLADVLVREVEISALAGDLERARLATTLANRMNPTLNLPEPVLPTVEEIDPEQPQVERRTPASGGGPCGVSYLRGDLEAAISDCRRAGRKGEAASRLAALTEVQQGLLILRGMAGGSSDQQLQRALTALTRSRDLDPTRKSPLTRELAQACADLALSLGDAAAKGGRDSDLAAAINYWERGKMTRVRVSEFNSRLSRLDQTAGKSCYQPIYAAWSAGSLKVDKGTRDLERCLSITPTSGEYNQKSSNLLNELHR